MANKRISELSSRTPSATDLMLIGDPTTGYSYKCLVSQVGGVTSVFGRTGAVTAQEGDYSLTSLSDVTITSPASGDILTYNGSSWVNSAGGFVPYTGATQNVSLGEYGILAGWYRLDTTPTGTPTNQGTIYWDDSFNTAAIIMNGTTQEIGHDQFYQAKNSTGSTIPKGTAVRFAGTDGGSGHLLIAPFLADGSNPSSYFMGVTAEAITNGSFGKVQSFGRLDGIDTSAFAEGDILYASTTVAGGFQTTVPQAPNNIVQVAAVISDSNNGKLLIRPTLGSKLSLDESVRISSPTNGQVLQYNSSLAVWQNVNASSLSVNNIYTADGTLTGNRTVTMGANSLNFVNANSTFAYTTATNAANFRLSSTQFSTVWFNANGVERGGIGGNFANEVYISVTQPNAFLSINTNPGSGTVERARFLANGRFLLGTTTDAGFLADFNGTVRAQTSVTSPAFVTAASGTNFLLPGAWFTDITRNSPINSIAARALVIENANNGTTIEGVTIASGGIAGTSSQQNLFFNRLLGTLQLYQGTAQTFSTTANLASSILSIESTTKGVLLPRMTTTQRNAIASPATGLIVYDTTDNEFDYYNGTAWTAIRDTNIYNSDGTLTGNRTVTMGGNNLIFSGGSSSSSERFQIAAATTMLARPANSSSTAYAVLYNEGVGYVGFQQRGSGVANFGINGISEIITSNTGGLIVTTGTNGGPLLLGTVNTERMRIHSTGNIGINTTTDAGFRLDVNGTARIGAALTVANAGILTGTGQIRSEAYFNAKGGSTTPGTRFVSYGIGRPDGGFGNAVMGGMYGFFSGAAWPNGFGLAFYTSEGADISGGGSATEKMTILANGNVGIGTTSPTYKLHVVGTGRITGNVELSVDSGAYTIIGATGDTTYRLSVDGGLRVYGSVRTANPSGGTSTNWRLGSYAAATVQLDTSGYLEVEVNGTAYKVALAMLP